MNYTKIWCYGGKKGRSDVDDFVVGYEAENGLIISIKQFPHCYIVDGHKFDMLMEAKQYVEEKGTL